ncbi:MAG: efflux RND transporter permease subunit, partial [Gammaproteobacteria bacterium]|nr:efflux RND transporter permease subunit [Gammaproteobacteria bacterium]
MQISEISIKRPVLATVMNLVIVLIGLIAYDRLSVRLIPDVDVPIVTVATIYPGANAQVIETQITQPIEDALSGIEGIDYISSISRAESSQVSVRFLLDRDPDGAASDVRDKVAQARRFLPEEAEPPIVQKQEADAQPIIYMAFSSDRHTTVEIADIAERLVKDRVQTIPGVARADVYGNRFAMRVWLDPNRLAGFELTPADIEAALRRQNIEVPAGRVESLDREFTVLAETDLNQPSEFEAIIVKETERFLVRLGDVARVELGAESYTQTITLNGQPSIGIIVYQLPGANALEIANGIRKTMDELEKAFPPGLSYKI